MVSRFNRIEHRFLWGNGFYSFQSYRNNLQIEIHQLLFKVTLHGRTKELFKESF